MHAAKPGQFENHYNYVTPVRNKEGTFQVSEEHRMLAIRRLCQHATDAEEALKFIDMLGLWKE